MLNLAIQASMLLSGLLVNFVTPAFFGVSAYGEFIAANALIFLLHKTVDIVSEPLIATVERAHLIFVSLALNVMVVIAFLILSEFFPMGSWLLLLSMLLSSSVLLSLHALVRKRAVLLFQIVVVTLFSVLLLQSRRFGFAIEQVMIISTLVPAAFAVAYIVISGAGLPTAAEFKHAMTALGRALPQLLSVTAVYNILTNALPLLLSFTLSARDLGIFKIATSVVQSANAIFPINTRTIFAKMVHGEVAIWPALSRISLAYFSLVGSALVVLAFVAPQFAIYVLLAPLLPVLYWTMLAERYWLSQKETKRVMRINLFVGVIILLAATATHTLESAFMLYSFAVVLYGMRLMLIRLDDKSLGIVMILCPLAVYLGPWASLGYLALTALLQLFWNRLNFQDIRLISRTV